MNGAEPEPQETTIHNVDCSRTSDSIQLLNSASTEQRNLLEAGVPCVVDSTDSDQTLRNDLQPES
jgi:hypothetical protein